MINPVPLVDWVDGCPKALLGCGLQHLLCLVQPDLMHAGNVLGRYDGVSGVGSNFPDTVGTLDCNGLCPCPLAGRVNYPHRQHETLKGPVCNKGARD